MSEVKRPDVHEIEIKCPKCGATSGNAWALCDGECPMPMSPYYSPELVARLALEKEGGE